MRNYKKYLLLIIGLQLCIVITNCSDDNNIVGHLPSNEIIPLSKGNLWKYHYTFFDSIGNVINQVNTSQQIIGDTVFNNIRWYYFDKNAGLSAILSDGYHFYDKYEIDSLKNQLIYKYPCNVGDKYNGWEVIKVDTQITVSAGHFNCILYSYRSRTLMDFEFTDVFIKPGIGIIRFNYYGLTESNREFIYYISDLTEYKF